MCDTNLCILLDKQGGLSSLQAKCQYRATRHFNPKANLQKRKFLFEPEPEIILKEGSYETWKYDKTKIMTAFLMLK